MARPIRVLQVVHRIGPGGIETWFMHVLREAADGRRLR